MTWNRQRIERILLPVVIAPGLALLAVSVCLYLLAHQLLLKDSGPVTAEALVVLGGGWNERSERAAELFKERAAPRILVSGAGDCEKNRRLLIGAGVPSNAVEIECDSRNTKENAQFVIKLLRAQNIHRAIIVTGWYHSRRALACFRHYGPEIEFLSRPTYYGWPRADWSSKSLSRYIRSEYIKIVAYWIGYGVCPF